MIKNKMQTWISSKNAPTKQLSFLTRRDSKAKVLRENANGCNETNFN